MAANVKYSSKIIRGQNIEKQSLKIGETAVTKPTQPVPNSGNYYTKDHPSTENPPVKEETVSLAEEIILKAKEEARNIILIAERQSNAIREESRIEGYKIGYKEGKAAAEEEIKEQLKNIYSLASNVRIDKSSLIKEYESEIINLVIDITRKVIQKEIDVDKTIVLNLLEASLQKVSGQIIVRIRVSPNDFELVKNHWAEIVGGEEGSGIEIIPDKRIKSGGCVIDTQSGTVDAQIDTQLTEIKKAFENLTEIL